MQPADGLELGPNDGVGLRTGRTGGSHAAAPLVTIDEEGGTCGGSSGSGRRADAVEEGACSVSAEGGRRRVGFGPQRPPTSELPANHGNLKSGSLMHAIHGMQPPPPPITIPSQTNMLTSPSTPLGTPLGTAGLSASSALRIPPLTSAPSANASPEALPSIAHLLNLNTRSDWGPALASAPPHAINSTAGTHSVTLHHRNSVPALLPSYGSLVSPRSVARPQSLSHSHSFHPYQRPLLHSDSLHSFRHPTEGPRGNAIPFLAAAAAAVEAQSPQPVATSDHHANLQEARCWNNSYGYSQNRYKPNSPNSLHSGVNSNDQGSRDVPLENSIIPPNSQPPHTSHRPQQQQPHTKSLPPKLTLTSQPPRPLRNYQGPTTAFPFSAHPYSAHPYTAHPTFSNNHHQHLTSAFRQSSPQQPPPHLLHQRPPGGTPAVPPRRHSVAQPPPASHAVSATTASSDSTGKPYKCTMCFKAFGRSNDLKRHALTHTPDEKPYSCRWCSKKFSRPDSVRKHELSVVEGRRVRCTAAGAAGGSGSAEDGEDE